VDVVHDKATKHDGRQVLSSLNILSEHASEVVLGSPLAKLISEVSQFGYKRPAEMTEEQLSGLHDAGHDPHASRSSNANGQDGNPSLLLFCTSVRSLSLGPAVFEVVWEADPRLSDLRKSFSDYRQWVNEIIKWFVRFSGGAPNHDQSTCQKAGDRLRRYLLDDGYFIATVTETAETFLYREGIRPFQATKSEVDKATAKALLTTSDVYEGLNRLSLFSKYHRQDRLSPRASLRRKRRIRRPLELGTSRCGSRCTSRCSPRQDCHHGGRPLAPSR